MRSEYMAFSLESVAQEHSPFRADRDYKQLSRLKKMSKVKTGAVAEDEPLPEGMYHVDCLLGKRTKGKRVFYQVVNSPAFRSYSWVGKMERLSAFTSHLGT